MILGSHDTMTYLQPQWWMVPLKWTCRCQSLSYQEQYNKGVRVFDLRIKFTDGGKPYFAHGLARYDINVYTVLHDLNILSTETDPIWVKVSYEARHNRHCNLFRDFCKRITEIYSNLSFFGGTYIHPTKKCHGTVYDFNTSGPEPLHGKHASWNEDLENRAPTGYYIDDIIPVLYAKLNNKKNIDKFSGQNCFLMIDFVGKFY